MFRSMFQYEDHLARYKNVLYKDMMVIRLSYLCDESSYTGKNDIFILKQVPLYEINHNIVLYFDCLISWDDMELDKFPLLK